MIFNADMDARLESSVNVLDPVGREEEYAFVVFEDAEEDCLGFSL